MVTGIPHLNDEEAERTEGEITLNEALSLKKYETFQEPWFNAEFCSSLSLSLSLLEQNRHASS